VTVLACPLFPRLYTKVYERLAGEDQGSAESRIPQFEIAFDIIQDHPLLGVGINNYSEIMWEYDNTAEGLGSITYFPVHNIFLHVTAETGILGAAAFMWLVTIIIFDATGYACRQTDPYRKHAVIGLLGGIIAFLVHGLADTASIGSKLFYFLWFYAGVIYAIRRMPCPPDSGACIPEAAQGL
jgi:O-antigen ligase